MSSFIRHPKDFWAGVIYAALGIAAVILGRDYPMGSAFKMGPAYFPTVLGGLLALVGVIAVVRSFVKPGEAITPFAWKEVILVLAATVVFGVLLRGAGLVVALIVLVLASAYASVKFRWVPSIALAIGMTVFSILVFVKGLGVPLQILGSWFGG
ncbi:MAG: tripartite tricarboxylate transporter TctB family protein [Betaproteobacteria bacterium]|nr:tripartite tricarboxylate transporter TctB family protein [Betaproteobacteria bacterium]